MAKCYVVGLGPGDPELITIKAQKVLEASDVIFVPQSSKKEVSLAREICLHWVKEDKIEIVPFAMSKQKGANEGGYEELSRRIRHLLEAGQIVTYVTLGDPGIYSTAIYLSERLARQGVEIDYIPGISAFNAGSSILGLALCKKGENFGVYEMPETGPQAVELIKRHSTTIFMKVNQRVPALLGAVRATAPRKAYLLQRIGLPDQKVYDLLEPFTPPEKVYLSLAIIKR